MVPSTMRFETSSRSAIAASAAGSSTIEEPPHDLVGVDTVRLGLEVDEDAVAQHRQRDGADVVEVDDGAPLEERPRLAAEQQRLAGARTGAPAHPLAHELRRFLA